MTAGLRYFSGFSPLTETAKRQLMDDGRPHLIEPEDTAAEAVVVCVHGFTATPYEVVPVAKACAQKGIAAVAPLLPGHGYRIRKMQRRQFGRVTQEGLLESIRMEIKLARDRYPVVGLYGHSMGGLIALILASEGLVDACATTAPALRLPLQAEVFVPLLCRWPFTRPATTNEPFYWPSYQFHHSFAVRALWQLSQLAKERLAHIRCPVLGLHAHQDETVPPVVLDLMKERITAPLETDWIEPSSHGMTLDVSGNRVSARIADFFEQRLLIPSAGQRPAETSPLLSSETDSASLLAGPDCDKLQAERPDNASALTTISKQTICTQDSPEEGMYPARSKGYRVVRRVSLRHLKRAIAAD